MRDIVSGMHARIGAATPGNFMRLFGQRGQRLFKDGLNTTGCALLTLTLPSVKICSAVRKVYKKTHFTASSGSQQFLFGRFFYFFFRVG